MSAPRASRGAGGGRGQAWELVHKTTPLDAHTSGLGPLPRVSAAAAALGSSCLRVSPSPLVRPEAGGGPDVWGRPATSRPPVRSETDLSLF